MNILDIKVPGQGDDSYPASDFAKLVEAVKYLTAREAARINGGINDDPYSWWGVIQADDENSNDWVAPSDGEGQHFYFVRATKAVLVLHTPATGTPYHQIDPGSFYGATESNYKWVLVENLAERAGKTHLLKAGTVVHVTLREDLAVTVDMAPPWVMNVPAGGALWAVAQADYDTSVEAAPTVSVKLCTAPDAATAYGAAITCKLPYISTKEYPNVRNGWIVEVAWDQRTPKTLYAIGKLHLDAALGDLREIAGGGTTPPAGWELFDAKPFTAGYKSGDANFGTIGATPGTLTHDHDAHPEHHHAQPGLNVTTNGANILSESTVAMPAAGGDIVVLRGNDENHAGLETTAPLPVNIGATDAGYTDDVYNEGNSAPLSLTHNSKNNIPPSIVVLRIKRIK